MPEPRTIINVSLLWFRQDLRLADHPALRAAVRRGVVIPVFIWSPEEEVPWEPGGASKWWLHQSLKSLDSSLRKAGSRLVIRRGPTLDALRALAGETGASAVFWNRRYEPAVIERDSRIKEALREDGLNVESFNGALLHEPWKIQNQSGKPFQVFTPFWKHCLRKDDPENALTPPRQISSPGKWPKSLALDDLELEPKFDWAGEFRECWQPGESGARRNLKHFLKDVFEHYGDGRNRPDIIGTSRLSPHLHFGEISPRQIWHAIRQMAKKRHWPKTKWRNSQFLAEIGWREFAHHLLYHFPQTIEEPLRTNFKKFPWRENDDQLRAWQKGQTGYPIVDAGMRELWATGWMHNRARMIVASFLVKDLLISWQHGAQWFWDTLVDADLASNTLGWQWTAGCGADAAPFFRIFNPTTQGEKFDPDGDYVRRWCPELAELPSKWIHQPAKAPTVVLDEANLELGRDYPEPIISHSIARDVALEAYQKTRT